MNAFLCSFNDRMVKFLSHPLVVAIWWVASGASLTWCLVKPSEIAMTLALSFLALAYASAISERQLRTEDTDRARDNALHKKIDDLIRATPGAHNELAGSEPTRVDTDTSKK